MDNDIQDYRNILKPSKTTQITQHMKQIKKQLSTDYSSFKVGNVYHVNGSDDVFFVTGTGKHPMSLIPCAHGMMITSDEETGEYSSHPSMIELHNLGNRFNT